MPVTPNPDSCAIAARLAALSPERRAVLERMLGERGRVPRGLKADWFLSPLASSGYGSWRSSIPELGLQHGDCASPAGPGGPGRIAMGGGRNGGASRESCGPPLSQRTASQFARDQRGLRVVVEVDVHRRSWRGGRSTSSMDRCCGCGVMLERSCSWCVCITSSPTPGRCGFFCGSCGCCTRLRVRGEPATLPPLPISYSDYAVWQRRELSGSRLQMLLEFWRSELAGYRCWTW